MKKIKTVAYIFFFIFLFHLVVNFFLILYRPNLEKNFFSNFKIKHLYYIFPNIFFAKDIYIFSNTYSIYVKRSLIFLNIIEIFKKNFTVNALKARNISLEILNIENKSFKNLTPDLLQHYITNFLYLFPTRASIKNISIKYNTHTILIDKAIRLMQKKKEISSFQISGRWNKIRFDLNIDISNKKNKWFVKSKVFLGDFNLGIDNIELKIFGDFDLSKPKPYILSINKNNSKYEIIKGNVNFFPLEVIGNIYTNITKGVVLFYKDEESLKIDYSGVFSFKLPKFLKNFTIQEVKTDLNFIFLKSGYKLISKISHDKFDFRVNIENDKGFGYILYSSNNIPFSVSLNDKTLHVFNSSARYPLNLKFNVSQKNMFSTEGRIFNYLTDVKLKRCAGCLEIKGDASSENHKIKINFFTGFSSSSVKLIYEDIKKNSYFSYDSFLMDDKLNFTMLSKKLKISYFDELSFSTKGEVKNIKKNNLYLLNILVKDLYYKNHKITDNLSIYGKVDKKNVNFQFTNESCSGDFIYDITKNYGNLEFNIDRKKLQIGKFRTNFLCYLQVQIKQNFFNLSGQYKFDNLSYDNIKILNFSKGEIKSFLNSIILNGKLSTKENRIIDYDAIYDFSKKEIILKIKNIGFLSNFKDLDLFSLEITSKVEKPFSLNKFDLSGKIYNENSEILISSANVSLINEYIKAYFRIKNLKIENVNFVGNAELVVKNYFKNLKEITLCFNDLWINEYFVNDKIFLNFIYNSLTKEVIFVADSDIETCLYTKGKISFLKKFIKFTNFSIFDKTREYVLCNGNAGANNDVLNINISKVPLNLIKSFFSLPVYINGFVSSEIKVLTVDANKKLYQLTSEFIVSDMDIETIKIKNILGKLSFYNNFLNLEKIEVIFEKDKRIDIRGFYNLISKNINLSLTSYKCDISLFNGFQNIVDKANGNFILVFNITGNINSPRMNGYFNITKGRIEFKEYLKYVDNLDIRVLFNNKDIKIEKFSGSYENTNFNINGKIELFKSYTLNIKTTGGDGIFVKIPQLTFPVSKFFKIIKGEKFFPSNGNIHLDISILKKEKEEKPFVSGSIILNNTHFTYPGVEKKGKFYSFGFYHNIDLIANNNVWYENEYLSANITGKVNFYYNAGMDKMNINGEIEAMRGKIDFLNNNFTLTSGRLEIINRNVYIELTGGMDILTSEREKIPVNLVIERNKIEEVKPKLVSPLYPELKTEELTALMLGLGKVQKEGDKISILSSEKIDYLPILRTQLIRMIDSSFATPVAKNILKRWGIADNFRIVAIESSDKTFKDDTLQSNTSSDSDKFKVSDLFKDTKYIIEKYLTPDMIISYSLTLAEIQNRLNLKHELEVSYRLKNNIFIKGLYDYSIKDYNTNQYAPNISVMVQPTFKFKSWEEEEKESK